MTKDDCHDIRAVVWKFLVRHIPDEHHCISNTCLIQDAIDDIIEAFAKPFPDTTIDVCADLIECLSSGKISGQEIKKAWYGDVTSE